MFCLCRLSMLGAEGFAINEWSAEGVAMGGARMFAENDAANNCLQSGVESPKCGAKLLNRVRFISAPHGKYTAYDATGKSIGRRYKKRRTCRYGLPANYYVKQLNDKDWIGIGLFSRIGMISGI